MYNIAIVEDDADDAARLNEIVTRYFGERGEEVSVIRYADGDKFIWGYKPDTDIVFLDIELPGMNGMAAAHELRKIDKDVLIIFVTNMSQYAVNGYEVGAADYILKPISYDSFVIKMNWIMEKLKNRKESWLTISTVGGLRRINLSELIYVESVGHKVVFHTADGNFSVTGSLKNVEKSLGDNGNFTRCNNCYVVNMRYIRGINGYSVTVGDDVLQISRSRRKGFLEEVNRFVWGGYN